METIDDNISDLIYCQNSFDIKFLALEKKFLNESIWQFPSGKSDRQETFKVSAIRIAVDNIGYHEFLRVEDLELTSKSVNNFGEEINQRYFLLKIKNDEEISISKDYSSFSWFSYAEFLHLLKGDPEKEILAKSYWKILNQQNKKI